MSIVQLFNTQRYKTPGRTALVDAYDSVTFADLGRQVDTLAANIRRHGNFKRGEVIPVCMDRGNSLVVAILAVLRAGGVYLAIPLELPAERVRYMLKDTRAKLVLSDKASMERTKTLLDPGSEIMEVSAEMLAAALVPDEVDIHGEDPAYIIYTSGTTGVPKGVVISHGAVLNLIQAMETCLYERATGPIREALTTPIVFDASVQQILSCVTNGNTLYIPAEKQRTDPFLLLEFLVEHQIELINVVASYLDAMVVSGIAAQFPASLHQIVTGGEVVTNELVNNFFRLDNTQDVRITNMYGPTENCVDSSYFHIVSTTRINGQVPIGTEVPGTEITIRDEAGNQVPQGETGEICVAGKGLATAYLNLPELTAAKFVVLDGQRTYKTGDLGFRNEEGLLEFSGRIDDQVKVNGYRIEPQEIQHVLLSMEAIGQAYVFAAGTENQKQLVAFVVLTENQSTDEIEANLRKLVPSHMVPGRIVAVDRFPLTLNGKTDKRQLLEMLEAEHGASGDGDGFIQQIAVIANEVCGREINIDRSFREQGIDSIQAIRLLGRIRKAFGAELYVHDLMESCNLRIFAARVKPKSGERDDTGEIEPSGKQLYTLSKAQKRLWHVYEQMDLAASYNVPVVFHLQNISGELLERSLLLLVERHPILRTAFRKQEEAIIQEVMPMHRIAFSLEKFSVGLPSLEGQIQAITDRESRFRFNLGQPPHIRASIIDAFERQSVILNFPHLVVDGWSLTILYKELNEIYCSLRAHEPPQLRLADHSYIDYAIWHDGLDLSAHNAFWASYLKHFPGSVKLPRDIFENQDFEAGTVSMETGRPLFEQVYSLCEAQQLTPAIVFLSAFKLFLYKLTDQEDLSIGMGVLGRTRPEWDNICGFFMNMLPVRTQFAEEDTLSDLLLKTRKSVNEILHYQDFPVEELARLAGGKELFNVVFAYQNFNEIKQLQVPETELFTVNTLDLKPAHQAKFDLSLQIYEQENGYLIEMEFRKNLFLESTVRKWLKAMVSAVPVLCGDLLSEEKSL